jgi:aspartyl-tRNA(Asn)/glutamyl-tRNA(Gln) amidotransferase subunit A
VFEQFDLLVHPAMPVPPPPLDDLTVELGGERMPYRLALIPFNSPWSLAGLPAASVPAGFVDGLPIGLAVVGRAGDEQTVLRAAHTFQRATDWHERRPSAAIRAASPSV